MTAALEYAKKGWPVFPLKPEEKLPLTAHGFKDASTDESLIRDWWVRYPLANIGFATGKKAGLVVLDFDVKNGAAGAQSFRELQARHGALLTRMSQTPTGGWHLFFRYSGDLGNRTALLPGLDIRGEGGYVVLPPSKVGGKHYRWLNDDEGESLPESLVAFIDATSRAGGAKIEFRRLSVLDGIAEGKRDDHLFRYACGLRARNLDYSEALTLVLDAAAKAKPAFEERLATAKLDSAWKYPAGVASPELEAGLENRDWRARLLLSKKGELIAGIHNGILLLDNDARWDGVLAFDEFSSRIVKRRPPPHDDGAEGEWRDEDDTLTAAWLSENYRIHLSRNTVRDVVLAVSRRHAFHLLSDKLRALEWDGTPRLEDALTDLFGTVKNAYTQKVGVCFFVQAVARIFRPGCKADGVLILEGSQGLGKSRAVAALSYGYFMDTPIALGERDSFLAMRGKWIIELSELDSMNRVENTRAKQFFSARLDTYRAPYARDPATMPRQCVFVGTTNQHQFLRDETGARRFWPIACSAIDLAVFPSLRDQLWAEAVKRFRDGERWWIEKDDQCWLSAEAEHEVRYRDDVWEDEIASYLVGKSETSMADLFHDALAIRDKARWDRACQTRIGVVMHRLGWRKRRLRRNGALTHIYETNSPS